jgi:putative transposon-encoded protein
MPRKARFDATRELKLKGILGFMKRRVTPYGTGAKVDCLKEFMGMTAYVAITDEEWKEPSAKRMSGERRRGR